MKKSADHHKQKAPKSAQAANPRPYANDDPATSLAAEPLSALLPRASRVPENDLTPLEKMIVSQAGISKSDLEHLKKTAGLGYEEMADILAVTKATLINKKGSEKFSTAISEKIMGVADVFSYGFRVFGEPARFSSWLRTPNMALGGYLPIALINNEFGREEVKNLLGRIEYGVYA